MDYYDIREVRECLNKQEANLLLSRTDEDWVILCIAPGQEADGSPYFGYSLGRRVDLFDTTERK